MRELWGTKRKGGNERVSEIKSEMGRGAKWGVRGAAIEHVKEWQEKMSYAEREEQRGMA